MSLQPAPVFVTNNSSTNNRINEPEGHAVGHPGIPPTWTSSAKDIVGCSLGPSRVWFTLGFGILNEVYYPRVDIAQIRDLGFIVADGLGFWVEVKRLQKYTLRLLAPGTPAVEIVHTHERFTLTLRVVPDPERDVLVIEVDLDGDAALRPYALIAPRLGATGQENVAAILNHGTRRVLAASKAHSALRWPLWTIRKKMPSVLAAQVTSAKAMAGRILIGTAHLHGITPARVRATSP
jgi:glucoamylase